MHCMSKKVCLIKEFNIVHPKTIYPPKPVFESIAKMANVANVSVCNYINMVLYNHVQQSDFSIEIIHNVSLENGQELKP